MRFSDFQNLAATNGLQVIGKNAYGKMGEFPVMLTQNNQFVNVSLMLSSADFKRIKRDLKQMLKGIGGFNMADGRNLTVTLGGKAPVVESRYQQLSEALPALLADHAIYPDDLCPICQQPDCDAMALQGGAYRAVHSECMHENHEQTQQLAQHNLESGSYLLGLLGAIIGGFVGSLPTILTIYFMSTYYSLLYALIPLAAYYGYRKLRGKQTGLSIVIICIISIAYAVAMDILVYSMFLIMVRGYSPTFIPRFFMMNPQLLERLIFNTDNIYSLLFIGLGIMIAWGQISQTAKKDIVSVRSTMETILPLHGAFTAGSGIVAGDSPEASAEAETYDPYSPQAQPDQDNGYTAATAAYQDPYATPEDSSYNDDYNAYEDDSQGIYADSDISSGEIKDNELY